MINMKTAGIALAATLTISGCALEPIEGSSKTDKQLEAEAYAGRVAELERREQALREQEALLRRQQAILATAEAQSSPAPQSSSGGDLFPPNPRPGECYAKVIVPAEFKVMTDRVLAREASEEITIVPARYETSTQRVLVADASTRLEVVPAKYETVTERVVVRPESYKIVEVPPVYKTVVEKVLDEPARTEWKVVTSSTQNVRGADGAAAQLERFSEAVGGQTVLATRVEDTGELMCLVEIPAKYKTVKKQVTVTPATTRKVVIPAQYRTVERQKLVSPATTREVTIPAKYSTVPVTKEISPAQEIRKPIPAKYETVTKKTKIRDARLEWRPVLCEVNMTRSNISKLQTALKREGCYPCEIDGFMGPCTVRAAQCYAKPRNLPSGDKYVTLEVIRALGLRF